MAGTLAEKVWENHIVRRGTDGAPDLLYIDLHLVHEVTSPQAFEGLRLAGRTVRRPDLTLATEDHNTPTLDIDLPIADVTSRTQIQTLRNNAAEFGVRIHSLGDADQGIVHQVGPQLGLTMPGLTVVCGDSHTSTHGAFGALAFGIGTSEVEHVLATQTLPLAPFKTMAINVEITTAHPSIRVPYELIRRAVETALRGEKIKTAQVGLVLMDDEELLAMNRRFLEHDWYTDVITFPIESEPLEGEIYISLDRAREQAAEVGVTLRAEVCRLAIHGALHLAGYDDATDAERAAMSRLEDRYLDRLARATARTP